MRTPACSFAAALAFGFSLTTLVSAQSFHRAGVDVNAIRTVAVVSGKAHSVVVTEFYHHGEIAEGGANVFVTAKNQKRVPARVLQLGPGDYCRLAFQTIPGQSTYEILYGGKPPQEEAPAWTSEDGLLLETREYKPCNFQRLDSVKEAFQTAKPIGADYVEGVRHAGNPFTLKPGPFLSYYSGTLRVPSAGTYGFMTSSQDCSFLLIDGRLVVDAPGAHGPQHQARPGSRKDIQLTAGPHKFEYYHGASSQLAIMTAAWEVSPKDAKPQPSAIPPEAFGVAKVGRETAGPPSLRTEKTAPDFLLEIAGSVPLPDEELPLVGVRFLDNSPKALGSGARMVWDFGDGQTSEKSNPTHVYLRPGMYTVKLTARRAGRPLEIANRVFIDQPLVTDSKKLHKLDDYLPILETYDTHTLDAISLRQLVLVYQAKADAVVAAAEEKEAKEKEAKEPEPTKASGKKQPSRATARGDDGQRYLVAAVEAGKVAFVEEAAAKGDEDLIRLARLIGPMARDQAGNSQLAGSIWQGAAKRISAAERKAEAQIEAADIAINDFASAAIAKPFLDAATAGAGKTGALASRLKRVWGDYYALTGDGASARKAYAEAETLLQSRRNQSERIAWQGAHGRSTEQFLKSGQYERAIAELRQWQDEFPADKINGYITLQFARYWAGRQKYPQAIALSGQLAATNADSPYIDQLLVLAAECHVRLGATDKAVAMLESLLKSYPGSPLVPAVKQRLARLKGEEAGETKRPRKTSRTEQE